MLLSNKPKDQTHEEWEKDVRARLKLPELTLRSYGGGRLNIVRQIEATLCHAGKKIKAVLFVQKGAPLNLLIGTDLLGQLGFQLLRGQGSIQEDLLAGNRMEPRIANPEPTGNDVGEDVDPPIPDNLPNCKRTSSNLVEVRLVTAVKVPARHEGLVRAVASSPVAVDTGVLFTPLSEQLEEKGVTMEAAVTQLNDQNQVTLVIRNPNLHPVTLEMEELLGNLEPMEVVPLEISGECAMEAPIVARLCPVDSAALSHDCSEREQMILGALDRRESTLTESQTESLKALVLEYADIFTLDASELGSTGLVQHVIDTGDHPPCRQPVRRISFALRDKVDWMVGDMLAQGVIRSLKSPWASPIVLVAKRDGSTRFCVDYRRLNSITKMDVFPLPRVDESLDLLSESRYFSTLDLSSGYWQVKMDQESVEKTAFTTHSGLYEFLVMPFGLCNAPATFQRLMETVLEGLARVVCLDDIDDILVMGTTLRLT